MTVNPIDSAAEIRSLQEQLALATTGINQAITHGDQLKAEDQQIRDDNNNLHAENASLRRALTAAQHTSHDLAEAIGRCCPHCTCTPHGTPS